MELNGGRLKLIGEIVYPKNRFVTLQCAQQSDKQQKTKDVLCDNTFDSVVIFNEAQFVSIIIYILNTKPLQRETFFYCFAKPIYTILIY